MFTIMGYDKDNDVYENYGEFTDINIAKEEAKRLAKLVSQDELIDVLVHVDCDDCPVRNHCMGGFHTTDKECREHLSDYLTGKEV